MPLIIDPTYPRYTRSELVTEMQSRFGDFSDGAFRRWKQHGLVAAPRHKGRWEKGKPGSREGLWSDYDRQMLVALLELRERRRYESTGQFVLAEQANIVVWSWSFWDEIVSLDHVRRALRTWALPQLGGADGRARSRRRLHEHASQAVASLAAPNVPKAFKRSLAGRLTALLWADDVAGLGRLIDEMNALVDPQGCGRRVGARGASTDGTGLLEALADTYRGAKAVVTGDPNLDDADWLAARRVVRASWAGYQREWAALRANASTPQIFSAPDIGLQISSSSKSLLMCLGRRLHVRTAASDGFQSGALR